MKEYWVNVYEPFWIDKELKLFGCEHENKGSVQYCNNLGGRKNSYRLHVREFESREAKELYLMMKYSSKTVLFYRDGMPA